MVDVVESVLRELGATPDQIDRERDRVRVELFGDSIRPAEVPSPPIEKPAEPQPPDRRATDGK